MWNLIHSVREWSSSGNLTGLKRHEQWSPVGVKNCPISKRPCQSSTYQPQSRQRVCSVTCCGHWLQLSRSSFHYACVSLNLRRFLKGQSFKSSRCIQMYFRDRRLGGHILKITWLYSCKTILIQRFYQLPIEHFQRSEKLNTYR